MVEIALESLMDTVCDGDPVAKLVLDPSEGAEMFFKYTGRLCMAYLPGETERDVLFRNTRHCIRRGDVLVYSLGSGQSLDVQRFFHSDVLPEQVLNRNLLTPDVLTPFRDENEDYCMCSPSFHFVILLNTYDLPAWAETLVKENRVKVVRIV